MLNDFDVGTEPLAMYVPTMYYCMEVDKVAFGTQGHTQKESYRKWHLAIVMCPFPSLYCYRLHCRERRRTNCTPSKLNCSSRLYNNKLSSIAVVMPGSVEPKSKAAAAAAAITRKKTDVTALLLL